MVHHHQKSDSGSFAALSRHHEFYIQGGDLFFLVERHQFRVHRYFFERESGYFRGKLTVPASPGAQQQGATESSSIILEDVTSDNFAKFLWVFYNPKYSLYKASVEDWTNILSLAHRWSFPEVKNLAVREMEKIEFPVIDRIVTYHANEVDRNLLIPRYAALCEREDPLTLPEGMSLGMETTLMIARAREYARANPTSSGLRSPTVSNVRGNELHHIVRDLFGITPLEPGEDEESESALPPNSSASVTADPTPQEPSNTHVNGTLNGNANGNGNAHSSQPAPEENGAAEGASGQKGQNGQNGHDSIKIQITGASTPTGETEEAGTAENGHTVDAEPNTPSRGGPAVRGGRKNNRRG